MTKYNNNNLKISFKIPCPVVWKQVLKKYLNNPSKKSHQTANRHSKQYYKRHGEIKKTQKTVSSISMKNSLYI